MWIINNFFFNQSCKKLESFFVDDWFTKFSNDRFLFFQQIINYYKGLYMILKKIENR